MVVAVSLSASALATVAHAELPQAQATNSVRERRNIDSGWRFALGHATYASRDFNYAAWRFFFAKAGYGDGPAHKDFHDRSWRILLKKSDFQ